jgi:hypothetical protein
MKIIVTTALLWVCALTAGAQNLTTKGKDFWFAFIENNDNIFNEYEVINGVNTYINERLSVYVSSNVNTQGVISIPLSPGSWSQNFTVAAGTTTEIVIPNPGTIAHTLGSNVIRPTGVNVIADDSVNVFAINYQRNTTDATVILPTNTLREDYYVVSYREQNLSEVAVVAVDDNTVVEITPPAGALIQGYSGTFPIIRTLDRGQVYQIQSNNDLTGTRIRLTGTDCRRFAVFSGNKCTQVGNQPRCDMLYEQMFPLNTLGKTYCTIPYATRDADIFRFLAVENNTNLVINGGAPIVLDAGQYHTTGAVNQPLYVVADKPIMAAQYSRSACTDAINAVPCAASSDQVYADPFYIMLSSVEQMIIRECTVNSLNLPNIDNNFINVLVKTAHTNLVTIDGVNVGGLFNVVAANPDFSYLQYQTNQGNHVIRCDSGLVAYVYGFGERESYGYAGDVVLNNIALRIISSADQTSGARECVDSLITFTGVNQGVVTGWEWDFGDGTPPVSGQVATHAYDAPGTYFVKLRVTTPSICSVDSSIKQIDVFRPDYTVLNVSPAACGQSTGTATLLGIGGTPPYQFSVGNGPFQTAGANNQILLSGLSSGPVVLRLRDAIGCVFTDTLNVPGSSDITLSAQVSNVNCFGGTDGVVTVSYTHLRAHGT